MRNLLLFIIFTAVFWSCSGVHIRPAQTVAALPSFTAPLDNNKVSATYFNRTHNTGDKPYIVLAEPVVLDNRVLYSGEHGGLIHFLNSRGYSVWLISFDNYSAVTPYTLGRLYLGDIISELRKESGKREFILAGASAGGRVLAGFFESYAGRSYSPDGYEIRGAFFLGTGFSYETPSVYDLIDKSKGETLQSYCESSDCARLFSDDGSTYRKDYLKILPAQAVIGPASFYRKVDFPLFFIGGRVDQVSPAEGIFELFRESPAAGRRDRMMIASEVNFHGLDYGHLDLFLHESAPGDIFTEITEWLDSL